MCRRDALALALILAAPTAARGQDAAAWRDSVERLSTEIRALRDSMTSGDSTVTEVARRSGLVVSSTAELRGVASQALDRFLESRARWFAGSSPSLSGFRIVLRWAGGGSQDLAGRAPDALILAALPDSGGSVRADRMMRRREINNPEAVASALLDEFGKMLYRAAGPALHKWLATEPPFYMAERERRLATMYGFVIGAGSAQRACVSGRIADCAYSVTLRPPVRPDPGGGYSEFVRADLLLTALEIGGPEAWQRLRAVGAESVEAQLSAAADMPADSLLSRWRARLLSVKPTESPLTAPGALLLIGWTAVILLGALGAARWAS